MEGEDTLASVLYGRIIPVYQDEFGQHQERRRSLAALIFAVKKAEPPLSG